MIISVFVCVGVCVLVIDCVMFITTVYLKARHVCLKHITNSVDLLRNLWLDCIAGAKEKMVWMVFIILKVPILSHRSKVDVVMASCQFQQTKVVLPLLGA